MAVGIAGTKGWKAQCLFSPILEEVVSCKKGELAISCKHPMEKKLTYTPAAGENIMRLCYLTLNLWHYSVLQCTEPCSFWLGIQGFAINGRMSAEVKFATINMVLVPRDTTQLKSWSSQPCVQWTVPASAEHSRFFYGLVLLLFGDICSLQAFSDYHYFLCSLDTKGRELFTGVPQSIIHLHLPLQIWVTMFLVTKLSDFLVSIQCSSYQFLNAPLYYFEQFQWAPYNGSKCSSEHAPVLMVTNFFAPLYNP